MTGLKSLRARMTLGFTTSFFALVTATSLGVWWFSRQTTFKDASTRVNSTVRFIAHEWGEADTTAEIPDAIEHSRLDAELHGLPNLLDDISLAVFRNDGKLLWASTSPHPPWPLSDRSSTGWIAAAERERTRVVVAGIEKRLLYSHLHSLAVFLTAFVLLSTPLAAVGAWVLVGRTLRPIGELADQADRASANALSAQLVAPSEDAEVQHLVATLNDFLDQLRADTRLREQFYAAAAHELRTPLAVISASIEVVLSRPRTSEEYQETLVDLRGQFQRLKRLTEDLLTLNRLNLTAQGAEESEEIDLADICQRLLELQAARIAERQLVLNSSFADEAEIRAPLPHAFAVIQNLIENTVRYAPIGGQVSISLTSVPDGVKLVVSNTFYSEPTVDCQRWLEPFYREDASRSSATGGNGLGLTISHRITEVNGWPFTLSYSNSTIHAEVLFMA